MTKDELIVQSPEDIRLQKYRFSLLASGSAMMLFALWTVLRSIVQIEAQLNNQGDMKTLKPLLIAFIALSGVELVLKFYVGLSARLEGLGRTRRRPYLMLGIIIAILSVVFVVYMLVELPADIRMNGMFSSIINLVVEATALYASLDLVISARRVRKLEKEMGRV